MDLPGQPEVWLPTAFGVLMALAMLVYVVLDGFDLGIGILIEAAPEADRDRMIASIGPFWDANETWLVLGIGLLLVAFPSAHGVVLTALYLPVSLMLVGLILRGVAFDFRAKVPTDRKRGWDRSFFVGSLLASLAQGFMLGLYITGLEYTPVTLAFAALAAVGLASGYAFIGATWLVLKTEGELQRRAVRWARLGLWGTGAGILAVSLASPLASPRIFERWFSMPEFVLLAPLPLTALAVGVLLLIGLRYLPDADDRWCWLPFAGALMLFVLAFAGLAYSFYPYVVPDRMTIYEAAAAPESLFIIFVGACAVLPLIAGYTVLAYTVFRGKAKDLQYG